MLRKRDDGAKTSPQCDNKICCNLFEKPLNIFMYFIHTFRSIILLPTKEDQSVTNDEEREHSNVWRRMSHPFYYSLLVINFFSGRSNRRKFYFLFVTIVSSNENLIEISIRSRLFWEKEIFFFSFKEFYLLCFYSFSFFYYFYTEKNGKRKKLYKSEQFVKINCRWNVFMATFDPDL